MPRLTSNRSNIPITIVLSIQNGLGCVSASLPSLSAQPQPRHHRALRNRRDRRKLLCVTRSRRFRFPAQIKT